METLLERPTVRYEIDPRINVSVGEAQSSPECTGQIINNREFGVTGLVSPQHHENFAGQPAAVRLAEEVQEQLGSSFDIKSPQLSMIRALEIARVNETRLSISLIMPYLDQSDRLRVVYVNKGNHQILIASTRDGISTIKPLGDTKNTPSVIAVDDISIQAGDQIAIQSSGATGAEREEFIDQADLQIAMNAKSVKSGAKLLLNKNSQANSKRSLLIRFNDPAVSPPSRLLAGSKLKGMISGLSNYCLAKVVNAQTWRKTEESQPNKSRILLVSLGLAALGGFVALRYGADTGLEPGQNLAAINPETIPATEITPQIGAGNGSGSGFLSPNETSSVPNQPAVSQAEVTQPILPDQDGDHPHTGLEPGHGFETKTKLETPKPAAAPTASLVSPTPELVSGIETAATWQPERFNIGSVNGLIQEIKEFAEVQPGAESIKIADAEQIYNRLTDLYGQNVLNLPDHTGSDTYRYVSEVRISAPGQAFWASQQIEDFLKEEIQKKKAA